MQALTSTEFKSCCAKAYEDKALQFLLGPSLHPGGLSLTKHLAEKMRITSTNTILDVACGLGESGRFLAAQYGCTVIGIDLSRSIVEARSTPHHDVDTTFLVSDGEQLPFRDNTFTNVISECSMCLMPSFKDALREIYRTLRPGGIIGMTDIATSGLLPVELEDVLMQFLCISHEIPMMNDSDVVETLGFEQVEVTDESESLLELLESIKRRLLLAELLKAARKLSLRKDELDRAKRLVALARVAVEEQSLRYLMTVARKPEA